MFAYIAGSPTVLIEYYGIAPQHYGWVFGSNALGLITASQLNARMLQRHSSDLLPVYWPLLNINVIRS